VWVLLRLAAREKGAAWDTLTADWPIIESGLPNLLIIGQFALAVWALMPALIREMTPVRLLNMRAWVPDWHAHGPSAWLVLAGLAFVLIASFWRSLPRAIPRAVVLATTVPVLIAACFVPEQALSPALRWGLAGCFFLISGMVWSRGPLAIAARQLRMSVGDD